MVTETPLHVWTFPVRIGAATVPPPPRYPRNSCPPIPTPHPGRAEQQSPFPAVSPAPLCLARSLFCFPRTQRLERPPCRECEQKRPLGPASPPPQLPLPPSGWASCTNCPPPVTQPSVPVPGSLPCRVRESVDPLSEGPRMSLGDLRGPMVDRRLGASRREEGAEGRWRGTGRWHQARSARRAPALRKDSQGLWPPSASPGVQASLCPSPLSPNPRPAPNHPPARRTRFFLLAGLVGEGRDCEPSSQFRKP